MDIAILTFLREFIEVRLLIEVNIPALRAVHDDASWRRFGRLPTRHLSRLRPMPPVGHGGSFDCWTKNSI